ncbi:hypothetical protein [Lentilactobacillus laojiaonis]|uniref:hypothetical protein n=1 Tax=Lentilactobacillus laojiaonis TaxID=2883998 RepID=UPI001D0A6482|nr:hypothetical protein [Lentilactobacillus laojiaonis]UDM32138.1 hypothetical protein LHL71_06320 [Lentilactobacillus laojiaonis]
MKTLNSMLVLASFGILGGVSLNQPNQMTAHAATKVVKTIPANFQHKWLGSFDEWTRLTPHTQSIGYREYTSWLVKAKTVKVYNKNHIRVYSYNMPTFDYQLKYNKLNQFQENTKNWHLYSHIVGSEATYAFHK